VAKKKGAGELGSWGVLGSERAEKGVEGLPSVVGWAERRRREVR